MSDDLSIQQEHFQNGQEVSTEYSAGSDDFENESISSKKRGRKPKNFGLDESSSHSKKTIKFQFDEEALPEQLLNILKSMKEWGSKKDPSLVVLEALSRVDLEDWAQIAEAQTPLEVKFQAALEDPIMRAKLISLLSGK